MTYSEIRPNCEYGQVMSVHRVPQSNMAANMGGSASVIIVSTVFIRAFMSTVSVSMVIEENILYFRTDGFSENKTLQRLGDNPNVSAEHIDIFSKTRNNGTLPFYLSSFKMLGCSRMIWLIWLLQTCHICTIYHYDT